MSNNCARIEKDWILQKFMNIVWRTTIISAMGILIGCGGGATSNNQATPISNQPPPNQAPPAPVSAAKYGQWSTLPYTMPINPIHAALLHTGKILITAGSGNDPKNAFPINTNPDFEAA